MYKEFNLLPFNSMINIYLNIYIFFCIAYSKIFSEVNDLTCDKRQ